MSNSVGWFKDQYPQSIGIPIIIHPSDTLGKGAFIPSRTKVLLPEKLNELKKNTLDFFNSLSDTPFDMLNDRKINQGLENSKITTNHICEYYCSKIKNRKK